MKAYFFQIVGRGSLLRFTLSESTHGGYLCQASSSGFSPISTKFQIRTRGPPEIQTSGEEKSVSLGESSTVWCQVSNQSPSLTLKWSHGGQVIKPDNRDFSILDTIDTDILKSVVLIRNVENKHFGEFICHVETKFGDKQASIMLLEKGIKMLQ